jgi:hypothetical protein
MSAIQFKRGDTFKMVGVVKADGIVQDMTGWTIKAQLRRKGIFEAVGLISELGCTWIDAVTATLQLIDDTTIDWPVGSAEIDIRLVSPAGKKTTTQTGVIEILEAVTRD